jgi:hypothetical protein
MTRTLDPLIKSCTLKESPTVKRARAYLERIVTTKDGSLWLWLLRAPATNSKARSRNRLAGFFVRKVRRIGPLGDFPRNARKFNAFLRCVTTYRRVHVTYLAHGSWLVFV